MYVGVLCVKVKHQSQIPSSISHLHFFFKFLDRVSLCSLGWPRPHYTDKAGLKLIDLCLLLPPES